ncbi:MAG: stage sporulation protein [Thermosediminibacterales bacterium]|nr:stage sporulation protein [Thermosediminibacterales bacterium]
MLKRSKEAITVHLKENLLLYILVTLVLALGIAVGSIAAKGLNVEQKENLIGFLNMFFNTSDISRIDKTILFKTSLINNLKTALLIYVLGVTIIGIPIILLILLIRGFILGFTVGFLINEMALKGFVFSVFSLLPQNLFILPAILSMGVSATSFCLILIKRRINSQNINVFQQFVGYTIFYFILLLLLFIGILIETYVTPVFIKMIIPYIE